jgi:hypothetical protein
VIEEGLVRDAYCDSAREDVHDDHRDQSRRPVLIDGLNRLVDENDFPPGVPIRAFGRAGNGATGSFADLALTLRLGNKILVPQRMVLGTAPGRDDRNLAIAFEVLQRGLQGLSRFASGIGPHQGLDWSVGDTDQRRVRSMRRFRVLAVQLQMRIQRLHHHDRDCFQCVHRSVDGEVLFQLLVGHAVSPLMLDCQRHLFAMGLSGRVVNKCGSLPRIRKPAFAALELTD